MAERKEENEAQIQEHGPEHWFSSWERQCLADAEHGEPSEEEVDQNREKLWHLFQNSATAVAQLYKGLLSSTLTMLAKLNFYSLPVFDDICCLLPLVNSDWDLLTDWLVIKSFKTGSIFSGTVRPITRKGRDLTVNGWEKTSYHIAIVYPLFMKASVLMNVSG